ncbi:hypothetical protein EWM64_g10946 [Hericium alpestre]|uniref:RPEL repeat protein n=1 Tax=Hericium alpestre TaxID=135208 RepID=A0A4Y9ZE23_9AGAM|nr:hypothetical protein EWM64_g10946 [Hericium alpestre]
MATITSETTTGQHQPVRRSSTLDKSTIDEIEKRLGRRPDKHELQDRNILKAAKEKLQRSQLEDKLDQKLQQRPKPEELVKDGILQEDEAPKV